jgi:ubiquinone/menaquinone biosynthesis C-methylase UbiE
MEARVNQYVFDNAADQASGRFTALEAHYDPVTREHLTSVGLRQGWRCLEVGGGGGSIGAWLSDAVGPAGRVTVTDIKPHRMDSLHNRANLSLVQHDITSDELPDEEFDLIHARLVLLHLPQRAEALKRMIQSLKPGGWLVLEEFDCSWTPVLSAPEEAAAALFERVHAVLMELLRQAGADPLWGRKTYKALTDGGLAEVSITTYAEAWPGGGSGIYLHRLNTEQVAQRLRESGITDQELQRFWALLDNPGFVVNSYPMMSARGRHPTDRTRG